MKYLLGFGLICCHFFNAGAQHRVVITLGEYPVTTGKDSIFIAGNFNNWDPHDSEYTFRANSENILALSLDLPAGNYEFKCTRGSWKKVETGFQGNDIGNRDLRITRDTIIEVNIEGWKDDLTTTEIKHTASGQVHIIDTAFFIPQLNRHRRIWVYLPEGYSKTKKHYPVLYMHDGQNLFDAATSAYGEWGVDECLDSLIEAGRQACIVVGIDNGPERMSEYNPGEFQNFGKGEADQYLDFLTETLKPFIDKKYRTLPDKNNSIIAGSSMGGLVSYYALLRQPSAFGKAGIFSPAFWTASNIRSFTDSLAPINNGKFFFYIGAKEGAEYVQDMEEIAESLGEKSAAMVYTVIDPAGKHNEKAWHRWFPEFYSWIMADGFNLIIKPGN
ncbi:MAG: alpha/beta hydrolase [Chitinophagaceae bacterium]|nr:alpha/beta hydrolase [Chitinophagaceae bacterium]